MVLIQKIQKKWIATGVGQIKQEPTSGAIQRPEVGKFS
jgi:hypothetical protein